MINHSNTSSGCTIPHYCPMLSQLFLTFRNPGGKSFTCSDGKSSWAGECSVKVGTLRPADTVISFYSGSFYTNVTCRMEKRINKFRGWLPRKPMKFDNNTLPDLEENESFTAPFSRSRIHQWVTRKCPLKALPQPLGDDFNLIVYCWLVHFPLPL